MDIRIFTPSRYAVLYAANESVIGADIIANQGTDIGSIQTRTGKTYDIVRLIVDTASEQGLIVKRSDLAGIEKVFMADYWAGLLISNKASVRTWVANAANNCSTSGGTVSAMAVSLSIPEPLAIELIEMMNREGTVRTKWV